MTVFVGLIFIIRGFDIDRRVESIGKMSATGLLRLFSATVSILVILVGIALGVAAFYPPTCLASATHATTPPCSLAIGIANNPSSIVSNLSPIIGYFIENSEILVWMGFAIYITTTLFFNILRSGSKRVARQLVELSVLAMLYFPISIFANTLINPSKASGDLFIAIVMFALALNFSIAAYVYSFLNRRRRSATPG